MSWSVHKMKYKMTSMVNKKCIYILFKQHLSLVTE